jgi:hypothetical protein
VTRVGKEKQISWIEVRSSVPWVPEHRSTGGLGGVQWLCCYCKFFAINAIALASFSHPLRSPVHPSWVNALTAFNPIRSEKALGLIQQAIQLGGAIQ